MRTFLVIILSFCLAELFLRISYRVSPKVKNFLYSSRYDLNFAKIKSSQDLKKFAPCPLITGQKINGFTVNSDGFYTSEYQVEKPADILRVGFIGDSFLIGVVPYQDNFVNVFRQKLQEQNKERKVEVINWGLPCLGPQYEQKIFEIEALAAKPDYLIWNFFVGNDFTEELFFGEKLALANLLTKNFYVFRFLRNAQKLAKGLAVNREVKTSDNYDENIPTFTKEQFLQIQVEKLKLFNPQTFPHFQWQEIQKIFLSFKDNCQKNDIKCLVAIIPDENQISEKLLDEIVDLRNIDKNSLVADYPQKLLKEFFEGNNIKYLDLLPAFREKRKDKNFYHLQDTHWNKQGNKLAGEAIIDFVARL